MKVVILAGGYGTRLSEETRTVPKPMVEIGGRPILWHIMKLYSYYGLNNFVICCGYKSDVIKKYFVEYFTMASDFEVDLSSGVVSVRRASVENWKVMLVDTGEATMTGGRIKRIREYLENQAFCLTYGDGVSDIDIRKLINFHREQGAYATVTAVQQPGRFGALNLSSDRPRVVGFREKSLSDGHFINGGFFVLEPEVIEYIAGDDTVWEQEPMRALVADGQLAVYRHAGYWQNMDTLRDKHVLESLWAGGNPPWCVWQ